MNKEKTRYSLSKRSAIEILLLLTTYTAAYFTSTINHYIASLILIFAGISSYFYFAKQDNVSYIKLKAVFSGVWLLTIGLATMKFLEYQVPWEKYTWLHLCLSHTFFLFANDMARDTFTSLENKFNLKKLNIRKFPFRYELVPERLFWVATVATLIGITSFLINVRIKGYIPFFVSDSNPDAYVDFYTRFHTFVVASLVSAGLAYYTLKKIQLSKLRQILLTSYIVILVFILPILLVQRGTFINAALILTTVIYTMSNRKFRVLFICLVIIFGGYLLGSMLRGYTDDQLNQFFVPKEITSTTAQQSTPLNSSSSISSTNGAIESTSLQEPSSTIPLPSASPTATAELASPTEPVSQVEVTSSSETISTIGDDTIRTFRLPPQAAFLYSYLTVSHDNFNSAVEKNTTFTWGIWQIEPFNVLIRSDWVELKLEAAELNSQGHRVMYHLNTFNLVSKAFYDFGIIGVIFFISLWSYAFGLVEEFNKKYEGIFSTLAYGVIMTPVALCFMNPWLSIFSVWLMWGTILIMFVVSSFSLKKRGEKK